MLFAVAFDMRERPSNWLGVSARPEFIDYVRLVLTYGTSYPMIAAMLAIAGAAIRLVADGHSAKLQRHDELLDVLEGRLRVSSAGDEDDDD